MEFTRVTIDTETYERLTELAFTKRMTRAEYLRQLINYRFEQLLSSKPLPIDPNEPVPTLGQAITGDTEFRVLIEENGKVVEKLLKDLPLSQRVMTQIFASRGKTIKVKKWIRETLAALPLEGLTKQDWENIESEN